jgi:predicted GIY-YIG superfamily endonuclease
VENARTKLEFRDVALYYFSMPKIKNDADRKNKNPHNSLTKERCAEIAAGCQTKIEFKRADASAYKKSRSNGWLDEICAHMGNGRLGPRKWPIEKCREITASYENYHVFMREQRRLANILWLNGWLEELTNHMARVRVDKVTGERFAGSRRIWTLPACREEAAKYNSRTEFRALSSGAYIAAKRDGWLDDVCSHMVRLGSRDERYVYVLRAIGTRKVYVGLTYDPAARYRGHRLRPTGPVFDIVTQPHSFKVMTKPLTPQSAAAFEINLIRRLQQCGWDLANQKEGGGLGTAKVRWTRAKIQACADQCATRTEMVRRFGSAYQRAHVLGIVDELFARHPNHGFKRHKKDAA